MKRPRCRNQRKSTQSRNYSDLDVYITSFPSAIEDLTLFRLEHLFVIRRIPLAAFIFLLTLRSALNTADAGPKDLPSPSDQQTLKKRAFPWHSSIALAAQWIFSHYDAKVPFWIKAVWWGSFVAEEGGVLDTFLEVRDVCNRCNPNFQASRHIDCAAQAVNAYKSIILNTVSFFIAHANQTKTLCVIGATVLTLLKRYGFLGKLMQHWFSSSFDPSL